jgi:hypothetical protein
MSHPLHPVTPLQVEVVNHPQPRKFERRAAYGTAVLTAVNPSRQIAGYDPLREYIRFSGAANAYVISSSISQANDAANVATPYVNPNGRLVQANSLEIVTEGQNEVWVTGNTYPTMIGYEIIRKVPE